MKLGTLWKDGAKLEPFLFPDVQSLYQEVIRLSKLGNATMLASDLAAY